MADTAAVKRQEPPIDRGAIRGVCPRCSRVVVSECHYERGKGYRIIWSCVGTHDNPPSCTFSETL